MPLAPLPIDDVIAPLVEALASAPCAVVVAPPGAGKTTRIPPALARAPWLRVPHLAVVMLQPRRVAARAAASRIASEQGWRIGGEVGWHIRFDNRTGPHTRVRVLTEGILARQLLADAELPGVGCVILDEFHERSIHLDIALAMLREAQGALRPDLRIVVMSATLDPGPVAEYLGGAPVFVSEGRLFPVALEFAERPPEAAMPARLAAAVADAARRPEAGHVLAFLPGLGEIRRAEAELRRALPGAGIHVLHSSVSAEDQDRALAPSAAQKIVLATNIAETSLTIDGVRTVVDSGLARVPVHDPRLGIERLELRRISRASAQQRAGRAGRTAPGRCLRLWPRTEDALLEEREAPGIRRVDLAETLLALRAWGVRDPAKFPWFEAPPADSVARAEALLRMLGAVDAQGALTPTGERLAALPVHPRLGRMLLAGAEQGLAEDAAGLAAILSERDILSGEAGDRRRDAAFHGDSDVLDRLEILDSPRGRRDIDPAAVRAVERLRGELARLVQRGR
jgi:ATP-dependent helicase HrpB